MQNEKIAKYLLNLAKDLIKAKEIISSDIQYVEDEHGDIWFSDDGQNTFTTLLVDGRLDERPDTVSKYNMSYYTLISERNVPDKAVEWAEIYVEDQ